MSSRGGVNWRPIEEAPKDGTVVDLWVVSRTGSVQDLQSCKFYTGATVRLIDGGRSGGRACDLAWVAEDWRPQTGLAMAKGLRVGLAVSGVEPTHFVLINEPVKGESGTNSELQWHRGWDPGTWRLVRTDGTDVRADVEPGDKGQWHCRICWPRDDRGQWRTQLFSITTTVHDAKRAAEAALGLGPCADAPAPPSTPGGD